MEESLRDFATETRVSGGRGSEETAHQVDASTAGRSGSLEVSRQGMAPLLTIVQVADFLCVSPKTVQRLVAAGRIPCVRFGRQIRFLPGDVFRWLEARKE